MRDFFKSFFASLLAIIVSGFILVGVIIACAVSLSKSVMEKEDKKLTGNVLVIDLSKAIHEQGQTNSLAMLSNKSGYEAGLYDAIQAIDHAKTDANIKGILLKLKPSPNGWATMQQLKGALDDFKTSHKFIYGYGEEISQGAYYVACSADSVYLNPGGDIELKGFATVMPFFKGTLDKLELQPEIFYAGKFKSATEPFRADKISDPNRQQIMAYQNGLWNQFLESAAKYTHSEKAAINDLALHGTIEFPEDAVKNKIVTSLLYWDQVEQRLRARTGQKDNEDIRYISLNDYADAEKGDRRVSENRIAVIFAEGDIIDGEQTNEREIASKDMCEEIRKVANDNRVKAVVLRVNSPGGNALASEVILRELVLLKQKKHLIVSMGDYAASGGYYISSMADSIFAMPNTITGSIGVFSMMFSIDKLMKNKLGVTFDEVKNASYADLPTSSRPLTPEEAKRMQNSVDTIYERFKSHVVDGRKLSLANVDSIAQGRVWTGADALGIGLVDGLGDLERAITSAAAIANIKDYKVSTYPEPYDKLNALLHKFGVKTDASVAVKTAMKEEMGEGYQWYEQVQNLRKVNGKAMMMMPFKMNVQ
jgi:protease-4